jgi:hypothetical protein
LRVFRAGDRPARKTAAVRPAELIEKILSATALPAVVAATRLICRSRLLRFTLARPNLTALPLLTLTVLPALATLT